jgi:hypothetical protein
MMWSALPVRTHWLLAIAMFAASASVVRAQAPASCDTSSARAEEAYYAADFEKAVALLRPCARTTTLPDSTRARMYRLLSFVYLGQNDQPPARRAVESLLDLQPTYTPNPAEDRPDFIALLKKAKKSRRAKADEEKRRWLRWTLGAAAAALGTVAVLLFGSGDSGEGADPLPRPPSP